MPSACSNGTERDDMGWLSSGATLEASAEMCLDDLSP